MNKVKYFLSFMGYPRSGHTLVAAILNANPNVICSNQQNFYNKIVNCDRHNLFNQIKIASSDAYYKKTTRIPHVPKKDITVIGDKTGHRTVDVLSKNPQNLGIMKNIVNVPIKWIHVVRNPFDNLATWARLNHKNALDNGKRLDKEKVLNDIIEKYRLLNETIVKLRRSEEVLTVNHEFIITRMHNTLEEICNYLEISFDPVWRDNVRETTWKKPRVTRNKFPWTVKQKKEVQKMVDMYPWLKGYVYGGCGRC